MDARPALAGLVSRVRGSGLAWVISATAVAGVTGYLITWLVPRIIGYSAYAPFAVFWSLLFFVANSLSGIQQEITRATNPRNGQQDGGTPAANVWIFALCASLLVAALSALTSPLWTAALPGRAALFVLPFTVGAASSVFVAVLTGTLYGITRWSSIFLIVVLDGLARLAFVLGTLTITHDAVVLAWAIVLPFPISVLVVRLFAGRRVMREGRLDVGYRSLSWNVARTTVAATSMGLLISGFPFVLAITGAASSAVTAGTFGMVVVTTTLVRAPLVVTAMALQSYFIIRFKRTSGSLVRLFLTIEVVVLLIAAVVGVLGWFAGPWVFSWLFPGQSVPPAEFVGAVAISSGLLAAMCVSAPAVLSRGDHGAYTAGWVVAAVATIMLLMLPTSFLVRTELALTLGPVLGLAVHSTAIVVRARNDRRSRSL